jgi:hypothetical protein
MPGTETEGGTANRIIESLDDAGKSALESVRKFLDTVNRTVPDVGADDGPRRRIIDSAFKMTEQLVGVSTELAEKIVQAGRDVVGEAK